MKEAILVASFGSSYNDTREKTIGAIERKIAEEYPSYEVRRAFTSRVIINKLKKRDGIEIDSIAEALRRLYDDGFNKIAVQPTHIMNGSEFDRLVDEIKKFENKFESIVCGQPLLTSGRDYDRVVEIMAEEVKKAADGRAVILMGHGTEHYADAAYAALDYRFKAMGHNNIFVGTVEGYPDFNQVKSYVKNSNFKRVLLTPFMIVAGDHANNDMAGDGENSWKTLLEKDGFDVQCLLRGIGEYDEIQNMFADHLSVAMKRL
ncbi:sirohydrochlorin cobaltochelatase [Clostridiales bacterium]|nr:sirohydrochlorin cobaltochelatase [Clostridiales bacterium]